MPDEGPGAIPATGLGAASVAQIDAGCQRHAGEPGRQLVVGQHPGAFAALGRLGQQLAEQAGGASVQRRIGLGLSLCRTVIEQHGGALDFGPPEGQPGARGTEFRFTLPVPDAPARRSADPA